MDPTTSAGLGIGGIAAGILGLLYTYMKHSKCKLNWCGKTVDFSVDLTPPVSDTLAPIKSSFPIDGRDTKSTESKDKSSEEREVASTSRSIEKGMGKHEDQA